MKSTAVIILAAGKGERMKSSLPKVLHPICCRPMVSYVLDLAQAIKAEKILTVVGYKHEQVSRIVPRGIGVVVQKGIKGTADAVKQALAVIPGFRGTVLVLYGDTPLLKKETIAKFLKQHQDNHADATLMTVSLEKPQGYGRIIRDSYNNICGIVEDKDANDAQKEIKEINTGITCFNKASLTAALKQVKAHNQKKEYYLTDTIGILYKQKRLIYGFKAGSNDEAMGINSRVELAKAYKIMQQRINEKYMLDGVTIVDPQVTFIAHGTKIGGETTIYPFTVIEKDVTIGRRCFVGPCAHLREGTRLKDDVVVGNFIELARSSLSSGTLAKHFSYVGDTVVGRKVNIGAGTVTANFDGKNKNTTVIKDNAFIGSDTVLVAPVVVGASAKTGAGSVVLRNRNVPNHAVVAGVPAKQIQGVKKNG